MMRRWMTILLAVCLLSGALTFPASASDEQISLWQSVEDFEQHALAYWVRPVHGAIQQVEGTGRAFGAARTGRLHAAIDFVRPLSMGSGYGTPIYAMAGGTVIFYQKHFYGYGADAVAIQHADGSVLLYGEIKPSVHLGDTVTQGEQIGTMTTGLGGFCMLHLELYLGTSTGKFLAASKKPDDSSGQYYKYVQGSYTRRSDLLNSTFLLKITREIEPHWHDWGETGLCSVCGCYKDPVNANAPVQTGTYFVRSTAALRAYPYSVCGGNGELAAGEVITVTGAVVNALGETWYRCRYDGETVYIEPARLENADNPPEPAVPAAPFTDLKVGAYYYDAVLWAVDNGIAPGVTDTEFAPEENCLRAQMVNFIWRAAGSPEPVETDCPFDDVSPDSDYYKAVLWAVENGVTGGTSATTFSPDAVVNRDQAMTFLWRAAGSPEPERKDNPFGDVLSDSYYYDAVLWAVGNGVTSGTSGTTFSPDVPCTRGQIVTFLYRCA